jgi:hypothetical protein
MKHGLTMQSGMGMTVGVVFGGEGGCCQRSLEPACRMQPRHLPDG